MSWALDVLRLVQELPSSYVESMIVALRRGEPVPASPNPHYAALARAALDRIMVTPAELAAAMEVALAALSQQPKLELVWTGPASTTVPVRQTEQVLLELIRESRRSLTLLSFGAFDVPRVVAGIGDALDRGVAVRIVLGERERLSESAHVQQLSQLGSLIGARAAIYRWPPDRRLRDDQGRPGLMHVKAAVVDRTVLLVTSANLTGAALERNMELGVVVRRGDLPATAETLIDRLVAAGELSLAMTLPSVVSPAPISQIESRGPSEGSPTPAASSTSRRPIPQDESRSPIPLEAEFEHKMRRMAEEAFQTFGVVHGRFIEMVDRHGGVGAAKRLMEPEFFNLDNFYPERPDLWVETWVADPRFALLFTREEIEIAAARLDVLRRHFA